MVNVTENKFPLFKTVFSSFSVFFNNLPIILKLKTEYLTKIKEKLLENKNTSFVQEKKE